MEPMEVEDSTADIIVADNLPGSGTSVTPPNLSVGADPAVAPDAATAFLESDFDSESSQPPDVRREV